MNLLYIHWNPDPVLFHIGNFGLRWYSIFWMIAILAACQVVYKLYQVRKFPIDTYQSLFVYCMVGTFVVPGWVIAYSMTLPTFWHIPWKSYFQSAFFPTETGYLRVMPDLPATEGRWA